MVHKNRSLDEALKLAAIAVYALLSILFLLYFVVLNSSQFILYAFLFFLVLGIVLSHYSALVTHALMLSMAFIIAGSLLYIHSSGMPPYYAAFAVIALISYSYMRFRPGRAFSGIDAIVLFAIMLPLLLSTAGLQKNAGLVVNVAIIGYYLLISVVVALFLSQVGDSPEPRRSAWREAIIGFLGRNRRVVVYSLLAAGILVLLVPIWPVHPSINTYVMPYANILINSSASVGNGTLIRLDLGNYSPLLNPNLSNIRFAYNGKAFKAVMLPSKAYSYDRYFALEPGTALGRNLSLYFLPFATGFGRYLEPGPAPNGTNEYNASLHGLYNVNSYKDVNVSFIGVANASSSFSLNTTVPFPYYYTSLCYPGYDHNTTVSFSSANLSSFFIFLSQQAVTKAVVAYAAPTYSYYAGRFANYSNESIINSTSGRLSIRYNTTCIYIAVVTPSQTPVRVSSSSSYSEPKTFTKEVKEPVVRSAYINRSFITGSLGYLAELYANETRNATAT